MNFGIIGFGRIARKFVQAIEATDEGKIYAISSRSVSILSISSSWIPKINPRI